MVEAAVHGVIEAQIYGYLQQSLIPAKASEDEIASTEKIEILEMRVFSVDAISSSDAFAGIRDCCR